MKKSQTSEDVSCEYESILCRAFKKTLAIFSNYSYNILHDVGAVLAPPSHSAVITEREEKISFVEIFHTLNRFNEAGDILSVIICKK